MEFSSIKSNISFQKTQKNIYFPLYSDLFHTQTLGFSKESSHERKKIHRLSQNFLININLTWALVINRNIRIFLQLGLKAWKLYTYNVYVTEVFARGFKYILLFTFSVSSYRIPLPKGREKNSLTTIDRLPRREYVSKAKTQINFPSIYFCYCSIQSWRRLYFCLFSEKNDEIPKSAKEMKTVIQARNDD